MRTRSVLTCAVLLSGLLSASAMAAEGDGASAAPAPQDEGQAVTQGTGAPPAEVGVAGTVPQVQLDLAKKREAARKRTEDGLKVRAQMMQQAGQ